MGHKHLHELLKQDQEPFHLKTYISDRRKHLKSPTAAAGAGNTSLNVRKRKPIIESTSFYIKNVCFFSFHDSPEFTKSPFLDFPAREKNAAVFNIPAKTAALLLDAAVRVQKPKPGLKQTGFGLLGSFLRLLKDRRIRTKSREIGPVNIISSSPSTRRSRKNKVNGGCDDDSRVSSGEWSEKSSELETSCSSRSEIECFCSPSVASPSRRFKQDKNKCPQETYQQKNEEKEQCSPVSVLDPLFDDGDGEERDARVIKEDYDIECSYANVQRAKHQLLQKLQRFERLAGLDPVKLEKHMLEQCYNEDDDVLVNEEEATNEALFREIVNHLGVGKIPWYMRKLIFDLIEEENKNEEHVEIVQRVCKRLHSWKVVKLNTIDMMVETDFRSEGWKRCDEETVADMVTDIEVAIFTLLVEELA